MLNKIIYGGVILSMLFFTACGSNKEEVIKIGHKNFTEQRILAEMGAVLLEENLGLKTETREFGGTMLVNQGMKSGDLDLSFEYTGTGYIYLLKASGLKDPKLIYEYVKEEMAKEGMTWLSPLGFNNTYAFAVKKETAEKYNLEKFSDFKGVAEKLSVGELGDFFEREDGMPGIEKAYGFSFGKEVNMDPGLKFRAIEEGQIDVAVVYATDALIEKYGLVVLNDDKNFFPPYDAVPRMKKEFADKNPKIVEELEKLGGIFSDEDMRRYNYEAEVVGQPIKKVAETALREKGLIK